VSSPVDRAVVQALWHESSRRLRAWFENKTGSPHDADDLVQETFLRVQSRLETLHEEERLAPWTHRIAANVLADFGRARGREAAPMPEDPVAGPPAQHEDADLCAAVAGWIESFLVRLGPEDAAILRAVDLEGRPQVDVARELRLSPSGARSRVQRARARLREFLEACCRFDFDARGNLTSATRHPGSACDCDAP
jgi:RNA polymerase sigma-70 factor, ECF subfamily